jgi:DNA repair photolyase
MQHDGSAFRRSMDVSEDNDTRRAPLTRIKGRGAATNREGRFESTRVEREDDGWFPEDDLAAVARPPTQVTVERARSIISRNDSPDIAFTQSINMYRGCEHGCFYCYARPTHSYLNLSAGLDFETKLTAKSNAVEQLRVELAKPGYVCSPINLGANTDPYQPIEREHRLTRGILEVLAECAHPLTLITKNAMVERDLDLLAPMAKQNLVQVFFSVTSMDNLLSSKMEPRASAPHRRIAAIRRLHEAGVPVGVFVAPIIPMINDRDLEAVLEAAREAGASSASYTIVRLPHELKDLFREWLAVHFPERATHVMSLVQQMRGGQDYVADFRTRMRGEGVFADLIRRRIKIATQRLGYLGRNEDVALDTTQFRPPRKPSPQGELF